jgi:large subunit ribosomal protein L15
MKLNELRDNPGARTTKKRLGRGIGSGLGKTSGRGHKGAKARKSNNKPGYFEGGQMPLYRRLPKRGFLPHGGKEDIAIVNVGDLGARFTAGSVVDPESLVAQGLIKKSSRSAVKVLGDGDLAHALTVRAHRVSEGARKKVEAAGGQVELLVAQKAAQKKEGGR